MILVRFRAASSSLCGLALLAQLAACGEEDDGDDSATSVADSSEGTDAMTTSASTTSPSTSDPTASSTNPSTDPTAGSGSMSGSEGDTSGADTGSGVSCEPEDGDDECNACTKASCCDQLGACFASEPCTCMTNCATGLDSIAMCTKMCGASSEFSGLTQCVTVNCAADCI